MATVETANAKGNAGIALGSTAVGVELLRALSGNGGGLQGLLSGILGNGERKNTQKALCIDATLILFYPDSTLVLICLLNKEGSRSCV